NLRSHQRRTNRALRRSLSGLRFSPTRPTNPVLVQAKSLEPISRISASFLQKRTSHIRRKRMIKTEILVGCAIFVTCASAIAQRIGTPGVCPPAAICSTNGPHGNSGNNGPYISGREIPNSKDAGTADPEQEKILKAARQLDLDSDQRRQLDLSLKAQKEESATLGKAV